LHDRDQQITKQRWSGIADFGFMLPSDHRHHADSSGLRVSISWRSIQAKIPPRMAVGRML
jgi:hypothetical protein